MPATNYKAEMSRPRYKCVYLETDIASYHYAPCEGINAASRPQKINGKKKKNKTSLVFVFRNILLDLLPRKRRVDLNVWHSCFNLCL